MAQGIFYGIVLFFVFIGVVAALYRLMLAVLHPKKAGEYIVVLKLDSQTEDPESLIYAARVRTELSGEFGKCRIVAVDIGLNEAQRRKCEAFCKSCRDTDFCSEDELLYCIIKD